MNLVTIPPSLQGRTQGAYPISVPTSKALEGIFGIHENIAYSQNDRYPYKRFDQLAINYRTMIRNIIGSVNSQAAVSFTPEILINFIAEEMSLINEIVASNSRGKLEVVYYSAVYGPKTQRLVPHGRLKVPKTTIQLKTYQLEQDTLNGLVLLGREPGNESLFPPKAFANLSDTFPNFKQTMSTSGGVLYLTHIPVDLVKSPRGRKALLESHTGRIKTETELPTKLKGKPEHVPFDIMTIQMFGDSGGVFDPQPVALRRELLEIGQLSGWNTTTTESRIKGECTRKGSKELGELVHNLYKIKVKI